MRCVELTSEESERLRYIRLGTAISDLMLNYASWLAAPILPRLRNSERSCLQSALSDFGSYFGDTSLRSVHVRPSSSSTDWLFALTQHSLALCLWNDPNSRLSRLCLLLPPRA